MARSNDEKVRMRQEIADHVIAAAIACCDNDMNQASAAGAQHADPVICDCFDFLEKKGCERTILLSMMDFAKRLNDKETVFLPPEAKTVRRLAKKMRKVAAQITSLERNGFMTILDRQEKANFRTQHGEWPGEDLSHEFPFVALPKWLEKRATMFEAWSRLASEKIPPKKPGLPRVARASLAIYVKHATGKPYYRRVLQLSAFAGLKTDEVSEAQMSRELKIIERSYPEAYREIRYFFEHTLRMAPDGHESVRLFTIEFEYLLNRSGLGARRYRCTSSELQHVIGVVHRRWLQKGRSRSVAASSSAAR